MLEVGGRRKTEERARRRRSGGETLRELPSETLEERVLGADPMPKVLLEEKTERSRLRRPSGARSCGWGLGPWAIRDERRLGRSGSLLEIQDASFLHR